MTATTAALTGECPASTFQADLSPILKGVISLLLCLQVCFCLGALSRALQGQADFRAFYGAGLLVRQGNSARIYDDAYEQHAQLAIPHEGTRTFHFLYPAFAAPFCVPLTLFPYKTAFELSVALNLGCAVLSAWLLAGKGYARVLPAGWLACIFLCFFPAVIALMQGQITFLLLLILTCCHLLERRGHSWRAGLLLSLGLVKFQFVLPMMVLYLCWRRYKAVFGFLSGATMLAALSFLLTGIKGEREFCQRILHLGASTALDPMRAQVQYGMRVSAEPNLHGLIVMLTGAGLSSALLTFILSVTLIVWCARRKPSMAVAIPAALLVSYHMQPYDLELLCLPLLLLFAEALSASNYDRTRQRAACFCSIALLTAPLAPYLFSGKYGALLALAGLSTLLGTQPGTPRHRVIADAQRKTRKGTTVLPSPANQTS